MKPEKTKVEATPTMPSEQTKEMQELVSKQVSEVAKTQTGLIETYLLEYCEVNGIKETELKDHVVIARVVEDNSTNVVNVDDPRDVKIGIRLCTSSLAEPANLIYEVYGEYIADKDKYPKTTKFLESINPKNK